MAQINIRKIDSKDVHFEAVFNLREQVLRKPLGLSLYHENTTGDSEDIIFVAITNENVIGCVMCKKTSKGTIKLRQMAVDNAYQKLGVGRLLILEAEKDAMNTGVKKIELHARQYAIGFYEKLGYKTFGKLFEEVGIPHCAMEKLL